MATMNLHWGGTLEHQWVVRIRPKNKVNQTMQYAFPYNATEQQALYGGYRYYYDERNKTANHSALYSDNQFQKKSNILSDMIGRPVQAHSFTTVVVIASLFLFLTLTITAAVVVFFRKRNTVFTFQKSDQDDGEYELEDIVTDVEFTETDVDSEGEKTPSTQHSRSFHLDPCNAYDSPTRHPLVTNHRVAAESRRPLVVQGEDPSVTLRHACHCHHGDRSRGDRHHGDSRGAYQQMVVTAVLEKSGGHSEGHSDSEDSVTERRSNLCGINKQYYGLTGLTSDCVDSDPDSCTTATNTYTTNSDNTHSTCGTTDNLSQQGAPVINITYANQTPNLESLNYIRNAAAAAGYRVVVSMENNHSNEKGQHGIDKESHGNWSHPTYVTLPPLCKDFCADCEVCDDKCNSRHRGDGTKCKSQKEQTDHRYTQVSNSEQSTPVTETKGFHVDLPPLGHRETDLVHHPLHTCNGSLDQSICELGDVKEHGTQLVSVPWTPQESVTDGGVPWQATLQQGGLSLPSTPQQCPPGHPIVAPLLRSQSSSPRTQALVTNSKPTSLPSPQSHESLPSIHPTSLYFTRTINSPQQRALPSQPSLQAAGLPSPNLSPQPSPNSTSQPESVCFILSEPCVERYGSMYSLQRGLGSALSLSSMASLPFHPPATSPQGSPPGSSPLGSTPPGSTPSGSSPGTAPGGSPFYPSDTPSPDSSREDSECNSDTTHLLGNQVCNRNYNNNNESEGDILDNQNHMVDMEILDNRAPLANLSQTQQCHSYQTLSCHSNQLQCCHDNQIHSCQIDKPD